MDLIAAGFPSFIKCENNLCISDTLCSMVRTNIYIDSTYILFRNIINTSIIIFNILFCSECYNTFSVWSKSD